MNALISTAGSDFKITLVPEADNLKAHALAEARAVIAVSDDFGQQVAVDAMKEIQGVLKQLESSRKTAKEPALTFGKKVDDLAKKFAVDLNNEYERLKALVIPYEEQKRAKARAEEEKRQAEIRKLAEEQAARDREEKQKLEAAEAAAKAAKNEEERKALEEKIAQQKADAAKRWEEEQERLRNLPKKVVAAKTAGQVAKDTYVFEVTDIHALYAFNRALVRMEENKTMINGLINSGTLEIPGLKITKQVNLSVRS